MSSGDVQVKDVSGREESRYKGPVVGVLEDSKDMGHSAIERRREMS